MIFWLLDAQTSKVVGSSSTISMVFKDHSTSQASSAV